MSALQHLAGEFIEEDLVLVVQQDVRRPVKMKKRHLILAHKKPFSQRIKPVS